MEQELNLQPSNEEESLVCLRHATDFALLQPFWDNNMRSQFATFPSGHVRSRNDMCLCCGLLHLACSDFHLHKHCSEEL